MTSIPRTVGPFIIERQLGKGGMGVVYLARDPAMNRQVAIKVISLASVDPELRTQIVEAFHREASAGGQLSHPGIVTIYRFERDILNPYLVMEYVNGPSLEDKLSSDGPAIRSEMYRSIREIAAALDHAHKRGIIHRDIKPANIMFTEESAAKICDFGIAKRIGPVNGFTMAGYGTPPYMSPEQIRLGSVSGRTDQYALGVVAYRWITGTLPFYSADQESLARMIVAAPLPPLSNCDPPSAEALFLVLKRALSKDPDDRFDTCSEFAEALIEAGSYAAAPTGRVSADGNSRTRKTVVEPVVPGNSGNSVAHSSGRHERHFLAASVLTIAALATILAVIILAWRTIAPGRSSDPFGKTEQAAPKTGLPPAAQPTAKSTDPGSVRRELRSQHTASKDMEKTADGNADEHAARLVDAPTSPGTTENRTSSANQSVTEPPVWPMYRGNPQRDGTTNFNGPRKPNIIWSVELGGQLLGSPVLGGAGRVYVLSSDRYLYAVDKGHIAWQAEIESPADYTPEVDQRGNVSVRLTAGHSLKFDRSGKPVEPAGISPLESALSTTGDLFVMSADSLRRLNQPSWSFQFQSRPTTWPVVDRNNHVYVGTGSGEVIAFDAGTGRMEWTYRASGRVTTPLAIARNGTVFFGSADRNLYCIRDGELIWKFQTGAAVLSAPVVDGNGMVFFGSNDGTLYALTGDGELVWNRRLENEIRASPAIDRTGELYITSINRRLYCLRDPKP